LTTTISVALCTHNGERFVAEQVASILAQTLLPTEIVVSDDASTDGTIRIVERLLATVAPQGPTVRILRNEPALGVLRNFEQAVSACSSELIALCDQDDRWVPDRLERIAAVFSERPHLLMLSSDARLVDAAGVPLGYSLYQAIALTATERAQIHAGDGFSTLLGRNTVTGATAVFRRGLLEIALPFPDEWVHDEWLAILAAATGGLDFLDDQLVDYRQHGSNEIGATRIGLAGRFRRLREPRSARNNRLLGRAQALVDRLDGAGVDTALTRLAEEKLEHETIRNSLPASHWARLRPVLREASAGGYTRYGRGAQDVLRDLVQPAR
jgi:glycosyltransferase involved in cell wall biosynthesis